MKIIFSIGDPNGIGLEILLKSLKNYKSDAEFAIAGNTEIIQNYANLIGIDIKILKDKLIVGNNEVDIIACKKICAVDFGIAKPLSAFAARESLETAVKLTVEKKYDAMVTMPISKNSFHLTRWNFPGQTEYVASFFPDRKPLMILFSDKIKVALATIHEPIQNVPALIKKETLKETIKSYYNSLHNDFAYKNPKIAVLSLNPHSGENGDIGREEIMEIEPAIIEVRQEECFAFGPFASDAFFARKRYQEYSGVLAMYHDQGLIPMKMLSRKGGVNFTANLPIVRVSPDHGTGYDIAGKNIADTASTVQAIDWAIKIAERKYLER